MFQIFDTALPGLKMLQPRVHTDARGDFVKAFSREMFHESGIDFQPAEEFFSVSKKNVVRGMHFQLPPFALAKLVYCVVGSVVDVVVDLRKASPTYGQFVARELSAANREMFFIPEGFAHGFISLEAGTTMVYHTNMVHAPSADAGILWKSIGYEWPEDVIVSDRDRSFQTLADFDSPF